MKEIEELGELMLKLKKEATEKEKVIGNLKRQNVLLEEKYDIMNKAIEKASNYKDDVNTQISTVVDKKTTKFSLDLKDLKTKLDDQESFLKLNESKLLTLKKNFEKNLDFVNSLKKDLTLVQNSNKILNNTILEVQKSIPHEELKALTQKSKIIEDQIKKSDARILSIEKTLKENILEIDKLEARIHSRISDRITPIKEEIINLNNSLNSVAKENENMRREVSGTLKAQDLAMDKKLKFFKTESKKISDQIKKSDSRLSSLEKSLKENVLELDKVEDKIYSKVDAKLVPFAKGIQSLNQNSKVIEDQIKKSDARILSIEKNVKENILDIDKLEPKIYSKIDDKVAPFTKQIYDIDKKTKILKSEIKHSESRLSALEKSLKEDILDLEKLEKKVYSNVDSTVNPIIDEIQSLNEKSKIIEDQIGITNSTISSIEKSLKDEIIEVQKMIPEKEVQSLIHKSNVMKDEVKKTNSTISSIEKSLKDEIIEVQKMIPEKEVQSLIQKSKAIEDDIKKSDSRVSLLEKSLNKNITEVNKIEDRVYSAFDNKIAPINKEILNLENSLRSFRAESENLKKKISETLEAQSLVMTKSLKDFNSELKSIVNRIGPERFSKLEERQKDLFERMKRDEIKVSDFQKNFEKLIDNFDLVSQKMNEFRTSLNTISSSFGEIPDYSGEIASIHSSINKVKSDYKHVFDEIRDWKEKSNQFLKTLLKSRKTFEKEFQIFRDEMVDMVSDSESNAMRKMRDYVRDFDKKERKREIQLNQLVKEIADQRVIINSDIKILSSEIAKFSRYRYEIRDEVLKEIKSFVNESQKKSKENDKRLYLVEKNLEKMSSTLDKLSRRVEDIFSDLKITKEKYNIELGFLLKEVEK